MKITIVIPAYNEGAVIGKTVGKICSLHPDYEVIVVNDGSIDNTEQVAESAGAKVISHPYNMGNGAAVKTGIRNATGDLVVLMDGDGQHDPADIPKLVAQSKKYDLVIGARGKSSQASLPRKIANWAYNHLATYVANFRVQDLTSGFRLFHRELVLKHLCLFPNTFSYPTTSTLAYLRSGHTVGFVPIVAHKRVGKSKIKLLRDGYRFLLIIMRISTLFSPLKVFLPISFLFLLSGLGYYMFTLITLHRFTNMSALLLSVSVMVFLLGMVSEQITQMRYDKVEY
ncbi:glycosyltransferase family 2 protein [Candidatus Pacearchaeota archaeon]|nr:glycosyltransferase family 2 protein [Candidatus Pacearchaeota archaeon]